MLVSIAHKLDSFQEKRYYLLCLSLLSGSLLALSWYFPFTYLAFIGLVPLLQIQNHLSEQNYRRPYWTFFMYGYIALLVWNVGVYWWLWYASGWATFGAWCLNAAFQFLPLWAYQFTYRSTEKNKFSYIALAVYWITFEHIHNSWEFSWIWMHLGHVFHNTTRWVQWYEYTGVFGGTLWVLVVNLLIFFGLFRYRSYLGKSMLKNPLSIAAFFVLLPLLASYIRFFTYQEQGKPLEVAVVQPNLNTYSEKFEYNAKTGQSNAGKTLVPFDKQIERFIRLSESVISDKTEFVLWPETALHKNILLNDLSSVPYLRKLDSFRIKYPMLSLVSGADTYKTYAKKEEGTENVIEADGFYYDTWGSALFLNEDNQYSFYHKSKLVIGVETVPYRQFLGKLIMNFGGTAGGLSTQKERSVFKNKQGNALAPIICYESVYGDFVTGFVRNGANFLGVVTNDDWWENTPGHVQHFNYGKLRAIETRRYIARSANTGISGFIDQRGEVLQQSKYREEIALKQTILASDVITPYVAWGDYIGRVCAFGSIFFLALALVRGIVKKSPMFR